MGHGVSINRYSEPLLEISCAEEVHMYVAVFYVLAGSNQGY